MHLTSDRPEINSTATSSLNMASECGQDGDMDVQSSHALTGIIIFPCRRFVWLACPASPRTELRSAPKNLERAPAEKSPAPEKNQSDIEL